MKKIDTTNSKDIIKTINFQGVKLKMSDCPIGKEGTLSSVAPQKYLRVILNLLECGCEKETLIEFCKLAGDHYLLQLKNCQSQSQLLTLLETLRADIDRRYVLTKESIPYFFESFEGTLEDVKRAIVNEIMHIFFPIFQPNREIISSMVDEYCKK